MGKPPGGRSRPALRHVVRPARAALALLTLAALAALGVRSACAQDAAPADEPSDVSVVVLSHVYQVLFAGEYDDVERLLAEIRACRPQAVIVAGDVIPGTWDVVHARPGSFDSEDAIRAAVHEQWDTVRGTLQKLDVPIWIAPGNHDCGSYTATHRDVVRAVCEERLGTLPRARELAGRRFLLLDSCDGADGAYGIGAEQVAWLEEELARDGARPLVFLHHALWYAGLENSPANSATDFPWMERVHPLLAGRVDHVFAGDAGNHGNFLFQERRDAVTYHLNGCGRRGASFLHVRLRGDDVEVLPRFVPVRVHPPLPAPRPSEPAEAWSRVGRRVAFALGGVLVALVNGVMLLLLLRRRPSAG